MPTANITTINAIATIPFTISFIFGAFFKIIPRITATPINNMETVAAAPLAYTALPSPAGYALKVPATISVNAAITKRVNNQQNNMKSFLPILPMYFSIIIPMDFPSFLTDAYRAPKSCTAPKNNPPTTIHKNTGTHPNTLARIGPVTGPAPAIDEN